ncbi:hypothetical protein LguiA_009318 [Lonicera macranthoides]
MITHKKAANAVGGKTARACDACLRKRARWYCAADDAFLCQGCDASVHSANQLAGRHDRVRLGTASLKLKIPSQTIEETNSPSSSVWHQGFTRKARTPRNRKDKRESIGIFPLVPEMGSEEASFDDNEEQLLYCVPVFDPFSIELCNVSNEVEPQNILATDNSRHDKPCELGNIHGLLPSDMELVEFAADVESLLGKGIDEGSCGIEGLGLIDCKEEDGILGVCFERNSRVKVEEEEEEEVGDIIACHLDPGFDMTRETIDWNFDYESPATCEEEVCEKAVVGADTKVFKCENGERNILLKLNYDNVITNWNNQGRCPWIDGIRPEFSADYWPEFMGMVGSAGVDNGGKVGSSDGGREARVTRYREKRRNRLFSKKIRYEVRKLNAEKRPRMKGRFVKRASSFGGAPPALTAAVSPYKLVNK